MNYPKIISVKPLKNYQLMIEFSNREHRHYDVKPLLKNEAFFNNVKIEQGGYAVSWSEDIDISEYELWKSGIKAAIIPSTEGCCDHFG
jgi:hypothetical protein